MSDEPSANESLTVAKVRRTRPAPPVLDLSAEEVKVEKPPEPGASAPNEEKPIKAAVPPFDFKLWGAVSASGILGGLIVALGMAFLGLSDGTSPRLSTLENTLQTLVPKSAIAPVDQRMAKTEQSVAELRRMLEQSTKNLTDVSSFEKRLKTLEQDLAKAAQQPAIISGPSGSAVARLTVAVLLRDRVQGGVPFIDEFDALVGLGEPLYGQDRLKAFALASVPSYDALRSDLAHAAQWGKTIEPPPKSSSSGLGDAMMKGLSRLVTVTPADSHGTAPALNLRAIDDALGMGDAAKAVEFWQSLPEGQRTALKPWIEKVEARLMAEQAADDVVRAALAGLKEKGQTP
jgi:hypothetical protein